MAAISFSAVFILIFRRFPAASEMNAPDNNPDKFYLWATNNGFSCTFTYNPHAADAWMFRTAQGHLQDTNQTLDILARSRWDTP